MNRPVAEPWTTMPLTPDEIRSREFNLADRGYDRAEVQAFLAEVANQGGDGPGTPWPEAEERLVLILEAAGRAIASLRSEASQAIRDIREASLPSPPTAEPAAEPTPAAVVADPAAVDPGPVDRAAGVAEVRERLTAALRDVETALGAIEPDVQRTEPSTRPSS
jgi:DivIVA domain-containing protein